MGKNNALVVIGSRGLEGSAEGSQMAQDVEHGTLVLREAVPRANRVADEVKIARRKPSSEPRTLREGAAELDEASEAQSNGL